MKKIDENMKVVSVYVREDLLKEIDKLADKAGLSRSKLIANMLDVSALELGSMEKLGVLATAVVLRNWKEKAQKWSKSGHDSVSAARHA